MEWFFFIVITFCLFDIEDKLGKLMRKNASTKIRNHSILNGYKDKIVSITIDNDDIEDAYLFQPTTRTTGKIIAFDDEWFVFEYKNKNKTIEQYFKIEDLESIDEIK